MTRVVVVMVVSADAEDNEIDDFRERKGDEIEEMRERQSDGAGADVILFAGDEVDVELFEALAGLGVDTGELGVRPDEA